MRFVYEDRDKLQSFTKATYEMVKERYERGVMVQRILEDRNELWNRYNSR